MSQKVLSLLLMMTLLWSCQEQKKESLYSADWDSLSKVEPSPEWFKDAKFGIYFHWGVYSTPAFANEWYPRHMFKDSSIENQHHKTTYGDPRNWPYDKFITGGNDLQGNPVRFAPKLVSEGGKFDPAAWADLFANSGAKFAGPVAEHHDGFSMWASKANPWNAMTQGPGIDLVKVLTDEIRKRDMKVILSMHHAYNITGFYEYVPQQSDPALQMLYGQLGKEKNEELWLAKHKEIIDFYQPDIIWQDFNLTKISEPVLLNFLSYYYNQANGWGKEVVATYKDALNTKVAVLDYERGGPFDIREDYWLTDDAISKSSWCYTEGIGYYSTKAVLHSLFDRVSKNGNLLLNISPKADGTIPEEQITILMGMGDWLSRYGEAIYETRAWEKFGEGPTEMGSGHFHEDGAKFSEPVEGKPDDIRFTKSKDNKNLYIICMGWPENKTQFVVKTLARDSIALSDQITDVALMGKDNKDLIPLQFSQTPAGLVIDAPTGHKEELGYVVKLQFKKEIPKLRK